MRIVPALLAALLGSVVIAACTNSSGPVASDRPVADTSVLAASSGHSVVLRIEERDDFADGIVDVRYTSTSWYDSRGFLIKEVFDGDDPAGGGIEGHSVAVFTRNHRGIEITAITDHDYLNDGTLDNRYVTTTLEFDNRGNPARMQQTSDELVDGTIDSQTEWVTEFDARGNLMGPGELVYVYDAHGNRIQEGNRFSQYNAHDQLIHSFADNGVYGTEELSTVEFDGQGNPTRQVYEAVNSAGTVLRSTFAITYDRHRNPLTIVEQRDNQGDGTINSVWTTTYSYQAVDQHIVDVSPAMGASISAGISTHQAAQDPREAGISRSVR